MGRGVDKHSVASKGPFITDPELVARKIKDYE